MGLADRIAGPATDLARHRQHVDDEDRVGRSVDAIALRDPASATVLAGLGGKQAVAQRFAWYQTAKTVAGSVGQFAAGALITLLAGGYAVVFGIAAAISVLPLVLVVWLLRGPLVDALRLPQPERRQPLSAGLRATLLPYAGLGLAICKSIIEAHGGRIWIQDQAVGTILSFRLPMSADANGVRGTLD